MEASTLPQGADGAAAGDGRKVIRRAAKGQNLSPEDRSEALDWFLSEDPDGIEAETRTLDLNFGTQADPQWVPWTVQAVGIDEMRAIRRRATNRAERRRGAAEFDEYRVNLEMIVTATVDPDIKKAAAIQGIADPAEALRIRLQKRPGFIAQIAAEIMSLSGFDEDDVKEADAAKT
jgi:Phage XkdN-like tail assembly chaperone protein, TAC